MPSSNTSANILKLDYNLQKGLILKWNLNGFLSQQFLRHVLIFDSQDSKQQSLIFAQKYFQKIKPGDYLTIGYLSEEGLFKLSNWREKGCSKNTMRLPDDYFSNLSTSEVQRLIQEIPEQMEMFDETCVVNFFCPSKTTKWFKCHSKNPKNEWQPMFSRDTSLKKTIVNFYGLFQTELSLKSQINTFNLEEYSVDQLLDFLKVHLNQIALKELKITIECKNGSLSSQKNSAWVNSDFNKIQKTINLVSSEYELDVLNFLHQDSDSQVMYSLEVGLEYETLEGKRFKAEKGVSIQTMNEKVYYRTIGMNNQKMGFFELAEGISLLKNPFKDQNFIWFKRNSVEYECQEMP